MPDTDSRTWPMPTVGGSGGTWGTELNTLFDDHIEADVDAVEATADAALPKSGGVMTGEVEIKTERYTGENLGSVSGSLSLDLNTSNFKYLTVTGDITSVSFSNWPASGDAEFLTLELTDGGDHTISWPAKIKWDGDSDPTLRSGGVDTLILYSRDGGTTIRGMHAGSWAS